MLHKLSIQHNFIVIPSRYSSNKCPLFIQALHIDCITVFVRVFMFFSKVCGQLLTCLTSPTADRIFCIVYTVFWDIQKLWPGLQKQVHKIWLIFESFFIHYFFSTKVWIWHFLKLLIGFVMHAIASWYRLGILNSTTEIWLPNCQGILLVFLMPCFYNTESVTISLLFYWPIQ